MKNLFYLFLSILFFTGCSEDDQNNSNTNTSQEVSFGIIKNNQSNNSNGEILIPSKIIVTLKDVTTDTLVYNKKTLNLFDFNGQYLTQNVTLNVGPYSVEEYFVTDKDNKVIYASPKEGSELAQYVNNPLPLSFNVNLDQVTQVLPEVLTIENSTAEQFGYTTFGFNIIDISSFDLAVFSYDVNTETNQLISSHLTISNNKKILYKSNLEAKTHTIKIPIENNKNYILTFTDQGKLSQEVSYTGKELKSFQGINNLKINMSKGGDFILFKNLNDDNDAFADVVAAHIYLLNNSNTDSTTYHEVDLSRYFPIYKSDVQNIESFYSYKSLLNNFGYSCSGSCNQTQLDNRLQYFKNLKYLDAGRHNNSYVKLPSSILEVTANSSRFDIRYLNELEKLFIEGFSEVKFGNNPLLKEVSLGLGENGTKALVNYVHFTEPNNIESLFIAGLNNGGSFNSSTGFKNLKKIKILKLNSPNILYSNLSSLNTLETLHINNGMFTKDRLFQDLYSLSNLKELNLKESTIIDKEYNQYPIRQEDIVELQSKLPNTTIIY